MNVSAIVVLLSHDREYDNTFKKPQNKLVWLDHIYDLE